MRVTPMNRNKSNALKYILLTLAVILPISLLLFITNKGGGNSRFELKSKPQLETSISDAKSVNPHVALTSVQEGLDTKTTKITLDETYEEYREEDGKTVFAGIDENTDVVYKRLENGIKEDIILQEKPSSPPTYRFIFETDGMKLQEFEGNYYLFDNKGFARLQIPKPFMVDAEGNKSEGIQISFTKTSTGYRSTVIPDFSWLTSPDRKYPVNIDPSILLPDKPLMEVAERRTINTKTYYLGGNKFASKAGMENIHYKDENGNWQDKDNTIVPSNDQEYDYMNTTNNAKVYFSSKGFSNNKAVKYQVGDAWMKFTLTGASGKGEKNQIDENIFEFKDAYKNDKGILDADYTVSDGNIIEEIILNEPGELPELSQEIELHNAYFVEKDGKILAYKNNTSELLWTIPKPVMYEMGDKNVRNYGLHYELKNLPNGNILLTKVIDEEGKNWLADSLRSYPVAIDISAGPNSPGSTATVAWGGTVSWSGLGLVTANDENYATISTISHSAISYLAKVSNFGFTIPETATIDGIAAGADFSSTSDLDMGKYYSWATYSTYVIKSDGNLSSSSGGYGGPSSLWGESWSSTDVNDTDFGFAIQYHVSEGGAEGASLHTNTLVSTTTGSKKIIDLKVGDKVLSLNENTNKIEAKKVEMIFATHISQDNNRYFYIYYNDKVIKATENHKFYTNGSYVRADQLKVGDVLLDINQNKQTIKDIKIVKNTKDYVWDISVEDNHNFFADGVLTHNPTGSLDYISMTVYYTEEDAPALTLVKSASPPTYDEVGDIISYSFLVTNTGNVSLTGPVTISDDKATNESCPSVTTVGNLDSELDPSEYITCTASYTITQTDIDNLSVTNTASASADGTTSPTDTETVTSTIGNFNMKGLKLKGVSIY